ncbi:hypothetical protein T484DRAFT_1611423, partial [Baffinella frigidus]
TLHPAPCTMHPAPCTLHPAPCTLHPTPCTLHPAPCTLHPAPCTLHSVGPDCARSILDAGWGLRGARATLLLTQLLPVLAGGGGTARCRAFRSASWTPPRRPAWSSWQRCSTPSPSHAAPPCPDR